MAGAWSFVERVELFDFSSTAPGAAQNTDDLIEDGVLTNSKVGDVIHGFTITDLVLGNATDYTIRVRYPDATTGKVNGTSRGSVNFCPDSRTANGFFMIGHQDVSMPVLIMPNMDVLLTFDMDPGATGRIRVFVNVVRHFG